MAKRAFFRAIHSKIWAYFLFGGIGGPLALAQFGKNFFELSIEDSALLAMKILVGIFIFRFLYYLSVEVIIYIHNSYVDSIWGKAIVDLKEAYAQVHYLRKQGTISDEAFMKTLISFCNILKVIFDRKTKGNCCVSIKVPVGYFDSIEAWNLSNLCRDSSHQDRDTKQYENTKHTVIGNTPYTVIVNSLLNEKQKPQAYYINNDIDGTKGYMNTSRGLHQEPQRYKSELVHAIVPILGEHVYRHELLGFLCVDCDKTDAFDTQRYDVPMVEGIVDGIYDIINEKIKKPKTA